MTKQPIEQVTMSTKEAAQRHTGVTVHADKIRGRGGWH